jgi:hypothetical protein
MHELGKHDVTCFGFLHAPEIGDQLGLKKFSCLSRQMLSLGSKFNPWLLTWVLWRYKMHLYIRKL